MTVATRTIPVAEVFGPTVQGEGPLAGMPTYFVRFGGCDYQCSWCDSLHAVLPEHVRKLDRLTIDQIVERVEMLPEGPNMVTLSGGNPALHDLTEMVEALHDRGMLVSVETQGSLWRDWLGDVETLVVSPKPPSSGEATDANAKRHAAFMVQLERAMRQRTDPFVSVKIVVFDDRDYEWAAGWFRQYDGLDARMFLSVGTDSIGAEPLTQTVERFAWLAGEVAHDPRMASVSVLPQLHVLAWGHKLGV